MKKTRKFRGENVSASSIAASIRKSTNKEISFRDVISMACKLGEAPHTDKWGTTTFNAYQANLIREGILEEIENFSDVETPEQLLTKYTDRELVSELRRRGWDVRAERKTVETL